MSLQLESKTTQWISRITAGLVAIVALIAFVLSYNALQQVALSHGMPLWLSYLWPLLIDFALVVFSFGVVRAYLSSESTVWAWCLVGFFTVLTIGFNLIHVGPESVYQYVVYAVFIVPPVALFLSFESLMGMLKSGVRRSERVSGLKTLDKLVKDKQAEFDKLVATLDRQTMTLADIEQDIKDKRREFADIGMEPYAVAGVNDPTTLKGQPDKRRPLVKQLLDNGAQPERIMRTFDISLKTLERDKIAIGVNGNAPNQSD